MKKAELIETHAGILRRIKRDGGYIKRLIASQKATIKRERRYARMIEEAK